MTPRTGLGQGDRSRIDQFLELFNSLVLVLEGYLTDSIQTKTRSHQKQSGNLISDVLLTQNSEQHLLIWIAQ